MIDYVKRHSVKYLVMLLLLISIILISLYIKIDLLPFILFWMILVGFDIGYGYHQFSRLKKICETYSIEQITIEENLLETELIGLTIKRLTDESMLKLKNLEAEHKEFNDYLEIWTHEIKLSIANFKQLADYNPVLFKEIEQMEISLERMLALNSSERLETSQYFTKVSISEICNTAIKQEMNSLLANHINVQAEIGEELIVTDKYWVIFCIRQIINNSIKYGATNIKLSLDNHVLKIADDGVGIEPFEQKLIFDKFYCGGKTKLSIKSTGIGLYLVKTIMNKYGYQVSAISKQPGISIEINFKD